VQSKVDGDVYQLPTGPATWTEVRRISRINFQFQPNGYVLITVAGYHVQDGRLDPRVAAEVSEIIRVVSTEPGAR
jgi:hypothetical protein